MALWRGISLAVVLAFLPACGKKDHGAPVQPENPGEILPAPSDPARYVQQLRPLLDPDKLATLGERGADLRFNKALGILQTANLRGHNIVAISAESLPEGWKGTDKGKLTMAALSASWLLLVQTGATTPEDMAALRRGQCGTIRNGPDAGDILSVDHFVPPSVCPEADNLIANLRLMPLKQIRLKSGKIGPGELAHARRLQEFGLISAEALGRVEMEAAKY